MLFCMLFFATSHAEFSDKCYDGNCIIIPDASPRNRQSSEISSKVIFIILMLMFLLLAYGVYKSISIHEYETKEEFLQIIRLSIPNRGGKISLEENVEWNKFCDRISEKEWKHEINEWTNEMEKWYKKKKMEE